MIFSGDEMIFQTFLLKQFISTYSLIKKRMGGNGPANEPPPTPPKGERDKKGITIVIRYTYNCCERVL